MNFLVGDNMNAVRAMVLMLLLQACSSESGDGASNVKKPLSPPTKATRYEYQGQFLGSDLGTLYAGVIGEKEVAGQVLRRMKYGTGITSPGELSESTFGVEVWMDQPDVDTFVLGGFSKSRGDKPTVDEATLDEPVEVNLNPPIGVEQTATGSGVAKMVDGQMLSAAGTLTYTMVSDNETVPTKMGTVSGCRHFALSVQVGGQVVPPPFTDLPIKGDVWYHPELGFVAVDVPDLNGSMDLTKLLDGGDPSGETNTIQGVGIVSAETGGVFELNTYNVNGQLDATKMKHAKMLLELRWADEETAKTHDAPAWPAVNIEFGTAWGVFSYDLTESPGSIFHLEENGLGYRYWYAFVDEAAKNEPGPDGISYHIKVSADTSITPPLRCSARIFYHRLQQ